MHSWKSLDKRARRWSLTLSNSSSAFSRQASSVTSSSLVTIPARAPASLSGSRALSERVLKCLGQWKNYRTLADCIRDTTINEGFGPQAVVGCGQVAVNP